MDASPHSSIISSFLSSEQSLQGDLNPPSSEGLVIQIVAAKPNEEIVC